MDLAPLGTLFTHCGVHTEADLENLLDGWLVPGEISTHGYYGHRGTPLEELIGSLASNVADTAKASFAYVPGIHHFAVLDTPLLPEEYLKKSLFLTARSTFVLPTEVSYHNMGFDTDQGDILDGHSSVISIDHVRLLFRFRRLMDTGALRVIGSLNSIGATYGRTEHIRAADILEGTRVVSGDSSATVGDAVQELKLMRQFIDLAPVEVPWIQGASFDDIIRLRADNLDLLTDFQLAYHEAFAQQVELLGTDNFAAVSQQVAHDHVDPAVRAIGRRYKRDISLHRGLFRAGAVVAFLGVAGGVVSADVLDLTLRESLTPAGASALIGLAGTSLANKLLKQHASDSLEDSPYYVVWRLTDHRR